ncbi:MAG: transporter substrate-binding domain-containing protein, partial [Rhodospirillum sp.]|nr:transporter substrate-binding domain-containing protein [Rhodospirillum sp.]
MVIFEDGEGWRDRGAFFLSMLYLVIGLAMGSAHAAAPSEPFTERERAWIAEHQQIRLGVVSDHAPYSFFRHGQVMGWSIDLWRLLEARTGLTVRFRMGNWTEIYNEFLAGRLDAIDEISRTEERARAILFTDPYHLRRTHMFQDASRPLGRVRGVGDLKGNRIGIIKDIYYESALRSQGVILEEYAGYRDMVAALAFGWIDMALAPELTGKFFARENGFSSVVSLGAPTIAGLEMEDFRIGVLQTNPILHGILSKALAAIPDRDLAAITDRWRAYRDGFEMGGGPMRLLPAEQTFIDGAPVIRVGFMPDYEPFSFLEDGLGQGFAPALAQDIADKVGLTIEPVFDSWPNLLDRFRAGDIQVMANISRTKEREAYTLFTREYHRIPNAVFLRAGQGEYRGPADLDGKRIAIGQDIFYQDRLIERFGAGAIQTYADQAAMMSALANGDVDAVVMALNNGTVWIRKLGLINITIGGEFRMEGVDREDLRFGVAPTLPYLRSILDRGIASTPPSQWTALETRWLGPPLAGPS